MLIRLHDKCYVNPINVAAVICGQMHVTVRMTNGRSHNLECRGKDTCPAVWGQVTDELRKHIDMVQFVQTRELTAVNVDQVLSIAGTAPGVTINMQGDWTLIMPCGQSSQSTMIARISAMMEQFK